MLERDIFANLSPLDHRYSLSETAVFDALSARLSEQAAVRSCARCEIALIKAHLAERDSLTPVLEKALDTVGENLSPETVYTEEETTKHFIRALVNSLIRLVPPETAPLVHLGATSADILDTAFSLRLRDAVCEVILPIIRSVERRLCGIAEREASTPQVGRTHGQHALPITFGFTMAEYVSRLGKCIPAIEGRVGDLRGKLSGPVGAYNGLAIIVRDPAAFEARYLGYLRLEASEYSTQLVEPEYVLRLLLEINAAFGVLANLADDLRNLQRSEISEVFEQFQSGQVGSSAMPQKRNPWNSEHVKSLWKAFAPRVVTFFMDQISEHQRDLTNSASQRFVADYLAGFAFAAARMESILAGLHADREGMARNLASAGGKIPGGILAEPAYLLLAESGSSDAHERIRRITLDAESAGISFYQALRRQPEVLASITARLRALGIADADGFFAHPERYSGLAEQKARDLARKYSGTCGGHVGKPG
ncbi:MAG: adenylosuccinate lyase [Spirochaetaceae bacterium]|nr:adenylosuccinate lyase [Spirochaetaceae bacterium]